MYLKFFFIFASEIRNKSRPGGYPETFKIRNMKRIKIVACKISKNNTNIRIEERYDETGINQGMFFVEEKRGKIIQEEEMPSLCTAMDIFENY